MRAWEAARSRQPATRPDDGGPPGPGRERVPERRYGDLLSVDLGAPVRRHRADDPIARDHAKIIRLDLIIVDDIGLLLST
ncbi:hypothetical protein TNCT6_78550 [Streptomyces sp. 6-11-2]|nr:hypothetical protein TNCT6_78550 [Streptomyces sp. 6-11-2]